MAKSVSPTKDSPILAAPIPFVDARNSFEKSVQDAIALDQGLSESEYANKMQFRQSRQGILNAMGNSLGQTLTTVVGQGIQGIDAVTIGGMESLVNFAEGKPVSGTSGLGEWGKSIEDWGKEALPIWYTDKAGFGSLNYILGNLPSVASTVSMLIPQLGAAELFGGIGKALRMSKLATSLLEVGGGALVGRHVENTMEASRVFDTAYKQAKDYGLNDDDARKNASDAATSDYMLNYANLAFDVIQLGTILKPFKMPILGSAGSKLEAFSKFGFEAADKRALDMTGKKLLDGAGFYEKALISTFRYAGPALMEASEGAEEFWNTVAQKEGERQSKIDALQKSDLKQTDPYRYEKELEALNPDSDFMDRVKAYTGDRDARESAIWGWIGGVAYNAIGTGYKKIKNRNNPDVYGTAKAADFAKRSENITKNLKALSDPNVSETDKFKAKHESTFTLAESALRADNMDTLIEDLNDDAYIGYIAKQNNIDFESAKKNVKVLQEDLKGIAADYEKFVGTSIAGHKGYEDYVNSMPFGGMTDFKFDFGKKLFLGNEEYTPANILKSTAPGKYVRIDLEDTDANNNQRESYVIAKREDGKLMVGGQEFNATEHKITDVREAFPVSDVEGMQVKRKGLFGFVQPEVGIYLAQLSFYSRKAEQATTKESLATHERLSTEFKDTNPLVKSFADLRMKEAVTSRRNVYLQKRIEMAKKAKVSDFMIKELESDLAENKKREQALNGQANGVAKLVQELDTEDVLDGDGQMHDKMLKQVTDLIQDRDLFETYQSLSDNNETKKLFAKNRQRILADPIGYYKDFMEDRDKLSVFEAKIKRDKEVYNISESDSEEIQRQKKAVVATFDENLKPTDDAFVAGDRDLYKSEKEKFATQYNNNPESATGRETVLTKQLDELRKKVNLPGFDINNYIRLKAELDAIRGNSKPIVSTVQGTTENKTGAAKVVTEKLSPDKMQTTLGNIVSDIVRYTDPNNIPTNEDLTPGDKAIIHGIIDPITDLDRFIELVNKEDRTEDENTELKALYDPETGEGLMATYEENQMFNLAKLFDTRFNEIFKFGYKASSSILDYDVKNKFRDLALQIAYEMGPIVRYMGEDSSVEASKATTKQKEEWMPVLNTPSPKTIMSGEPFFNYPAFIKTGLTEAFNQLESWMNEERAKRPQSAPKVEVTKVQATEEEVKSGEATSTDIEPVGGAAAITLHTDIARAVSGKDMNPDFFEVMGSIENDGFVTVYKGPMISTGFNEVGKPLVSIGINEAFFDLALMNPDSSKLIKNGDIVEIEHTPTKDEPNRMLVYKIGNNNERIPAGQIASSTKNEKAKAAEERFFHDMIIGGKPKRFTIASNGIGFGFLLESDKLGEGRDAAKKLLKLSDMHPIEKINTNSNDSMHLGVSNGFAITERNGSALTAIVPNGGIVVGNNIGSNHIGQTGAIVPTNTVYGSNNKGDIKGKQAYVQMLLHTMPLSSVKVKGDTMPIAVMKKLLDPLNNQQFLRDTMKMIGKNIPEGEIDDETIAEFYTEPNMIKIFSQLMFLKGALKSENSIGQRDYTYPVHIGVLTKDGVIQLTVSNIDSEGKRVETYFPVNDSKVTEMHAQKLRNFEQSFINNPAAGIDKPFRVDSGLIHKDSTFGAYTGFGIVDGDIAVKTYPSYLHYLDENGIVKGTFASVELPGQNRRTFFGKPSIKINFEKGQTESVQSTQTQANAAPIVKPTSEKQIIDQARIDTLEHTYLKNAVLNPDEKTYSVNGTDFDRVHTVMGGDFESNDLTDKAVQFGNVVDTAVRDFFNDGLLGKTAYPGLQSFRKQFETGIQKFQDYLESCGERVLKGVNTVYGTLENVDDHITRNIAGALDIVTVNQQNEITIYDTKTLRGNVKEGIASRIEKWQDQLDLYGELMKNHGYDIKGKYILPIGLLYGKDNDDIVGMDFPGTVVELSLQPSDRMKYKSERSFYDTPIGGESVAKTTENKHADRKAQRQAKIDALGRKNISSNKITSLLNSDDTSNLYRILNDTSVDSTVRSNLQELAKNAILDVMYQEAIIRKNGNINVEKSLLPKAKDAIRNRIESLEHQLDNIEEYSPEYKRIDDIIAYNEFLLQRFDNNDFNDTTKEQVGPFVGYFRSAYVEVSTSKIVTNRVEDGDNFDFSSNEAESVENQDAKNSKRFGDEMYTSINPKSTVSFQTKLFLSRIPKRDSNGGLVMNEAGAYQYYSLDEALRRMYNYMDIFGSDIFKEDGKGIEDIAANSGDKLISDLSQAINELDHILPENDGVVNWPYTKQQMLGKLAAAMIQNNRKTRILQMNYNDLENKDVAGGMRSRLIETNRQQIQLQIQQVWDTNLKELMPTLYNIDQATDENGLPAVKIAGLKQSQHQTYERIPEGYKPYDITVNAKAEESGNAYAMAKADLYHQLQDLSEEAKANPKKRFYVNIDPTESIKLLDEKGNEKGTILRSEILQMLGLVDLNDNIYFKSADAVNLKESILGNIAQSVSGLINNTGLNSSYDQITYELLASQLRRVGIELSDDGTDGEVLSKLEKNIGKDRQFFQTIDGGATTLRRFLQQTLLEDKGVFSELRNDNTIGEMNLESPFGNMGLVLSKLSKLSRTSYKSLINPNSTNIFGEQEFTIVPHTNLSKRVQQIKNNIAVRQMLLGENPLSRDNKQLQEILKDPKLLESFDLVDVRGVDFNGDNKVSNKKLNGSQRRIMDYNLFQTGESIGKATKGVGYYTTFHGESLSIPALSMMKEQIDYTFVVDRATNGVQLMLNSSNSRTYDILSSQFLSEVNAIVEAERVIRTLENIEKKDGREAAIKYANLNYKFGYHYRIGNEGQLLPGNRTKFYSIGKNAFEDVEGRIYKNGRLNSMFEPLIDPKSEPIVQQQAKQALLRQVFDSYGTKFFNDAINAEIQELSKNKGEYFVNDKIKVKKVNPETSLYTGYVQGLKFPLFNNEYAHKQTVFLLEGSTSSEFTTPPMQILYKGETDTVPTTSIAGQSMFINDNLSKKAELNEQRKAHNIEVKKETLFGEIQKHYMVADYILNRVMMQNTFDALFADPADFKNADNWEARLEEIGKRYKTLLGPGSIKMGNMEFDVNDHANTNIIATTNIADPRAHELKVDILADTANHNLILNDFFKWVRSNKGNGTLGKKIASVFDFSNEKAFTIPSNYRELASVFAANKESWTLSQTQAAIWAYLNQELTDGGAVMTLREQIARWVNNGDLDIAKAPTLFRELSNPNLTGTAFMDILGNYNVKGSTVRINKWLHSGITPGKYSTDYGSITISEYNMLKNSEITAIPAFIKGTPWEGIIGDMEEATKKLITSRGFDHNSPDGFHYGGIIEPLSAVKSVGKMPLSVFDSKGNYNGKISEIGVQNIMARENSREQLEKSLKEDMLTTVSTQLGPMSQLGFSGLSDFSTNNSHGINIPGKINITDINNMRYNIEDQQTSHELNKVMNKLGVGKVNNKYQIQDRAAFIKRMGEQVVNQQGIGLHIESFKVENNQLRAPLSYTPHNIVAQNVILNMFQKAIKRKINGFSLIQASTMSMFNKGNIQVDNNLKDGRMTIEDSGQKFVSRIDAENAFSQEDIHSIVEERTPSGQIVYKANVFKVHPSEVAMGWNLKDKDGNLLDYETYVDPITHEPRLEMFDDQMLNALAYRIPNTPHNTSAYARVTKFLPPFYRDVVMVSPGLMTAMSSDLDVDVLNFLFYNYEIGENGRISKVASIVHENQDGAESILNSEANKERVKARMLNSDYEYSRLNTAYEKASYDYMTKKKALLDAINDPTKTPAQLVKMLKEDHDISELAKYVKQFENTLSQSDIIAEINSIDQLRTAADMKEYFPEQYAQILDQNPDIEDDEVVDQLKSYAKNVRQEFKKSLKTVSKQAEAAFEGIYNELGKLYTTIDGIQTSFDDLKEAMDKRKKSVLHNFEHNFSTKYSIWDKQDQRQLDNGMIDTFLMQYSSPAGYKLSSRPLSTDILKNKATGLNIKWIGADGKVASTSIDEAINGKNFKAHNSYTYMMNARAAAKDNSDMIGIFANALRLSQYASAAGFYINSTPEVKEGIKYQRSIKDEHGILTPEFNNANNSLQANIKSEEGMTGYRTNESQYDSSIHKPGQIEYAYHNDAFTNMLPDDTTRFRLDRNYHIDNEGNKLMVMDVFMQSLQAVLDGTKDPIASKLGITKSNINAYIAHVMLGYYDESIGLFQQPIVKQYINDIVEGTVEKKFVTDKEIMAFVSNYIKANNIKTVKDPSKYEGSNPIDFIDYLLSGQNIHTSEASFNNDIVRYNNLDKKGLPITEDFHKRQLVGLMNYVKADKIGKNLTNVAITLNPYSKGLPGSILELEEIYNKFQNLYQVTKIGVDDEGKNIYRGESSAPLIGNLKRISSDFINPKFSQDRFITTAKSPVELTFSNVVKPILDLMNQANTNNVFTELSAGNKKMYKRLIDGTNLYDSAKTKKNLALHFESFMFSNPDLYKNRFSNPEEFQILKDFGIEPLLTRNAKMNPELEKRLAAIENKSVFVNDKSVGDFVADLKKRSDAQGIPYTTKYKLLGALKPINNNNKLMSPDFLLYMNIADFKGGFESEYMLGIDQMLDSNDKDIKALAEQMILYTYMGGAMSSPNSFIKFIAPSTIDNVLTELNKSLQAFDTSARHNKTEEKQMANDIIKSFQVNFLQHNPWEAKPIDYDNKTVQVLDIKDGKPIYMKFNEKLSRMVMLVSNNAKSKLYYQKALVVKQSDDEGKIRLFQYDYIDGVPALIEIDKAGNNRYNFREYNYNQEQQAISSVSPKNVSGGKKRIMIDRALRDAEEEQTPENIVGVSERLTNDEYTASTFRGWLNDESTDYFRTIPLHLRSYTNQIIKARVGGINIISNDNMDGWAYGEYNPETDQIQINRERLRQAGVSGVNQFIETINHELTHAAIDRAVLGYIDPLFTIAGTDGNRVSPITDAQRMALAQPMKNLQQIFTITHAALTDKNSPMRATFEAMVDKYKNAEIAKDTYTMKELAFVPEVLVKMTEYVKKYGEKALTDVDLTDRGMLDAYTSLNREFITYFMTNKDMQSLLDKVSLKKGEDKTIWQQIIDTFLDILDKLTGGAFGIRELSVGERNAFSEITPESLAHYTAVTGLDLINTAAALRPKATYTRSVATTRMKVVESNDGFEDFNISQNPDNLFVIPGNKIGKSEEYAAVKDYKNAMMLPVYKENGSLFKEDEIGEIDKAFDKIKKAAPNFEYGYISSEIVAAYKDEPAVQEAISRNLEELKKAWPIGGNTSNNRLNSLIQLADMKFDQAEVDEVNAYEKCRS